LYKFTSAFRGSTSALIYQKALVKSAGYNELAAVTLMSTDIDRLTMSLTRVMELWAQLIEVALGVWFLWRQIGAIAIAPIIITLLSFIGQSYSSSFMAPRQARYVVQPKFCFLIVIDNEYRWVRAVQRRVGISSTIIRQMKSIKLSGLVDSMAALVQSERVRELYMAKQFRGLSVFVNTVSNFPTTFSPVVSFAAYQIKAQINGTPSLTTAQAFTSFSILSLLTSPASQFLSALPMIVAGMGCVRRIHAFCSAEPFDDIREVSTENRGNFDDDDDKGGSQYDEKSSGNSDKPMISVKDLVVLKPAGEKQPNPINFEATRGSLTTILGPVGCGKSTLLRCLLSELKPVAGNIFVRTPYIGYCSQNPWLPNERIRHAIVGAGEYDEEWYRKVISVCELDTDFTQMPENDLTIMGSRGIVLSGGQKHRIVSSCSPHGGISLISCTVSGKSTLRSRAFAYS
jgi:ATP-binding cassette subfamily C (CFTR/MRP) protein 1